MSTTKTAVRADPAVSEWITRFYEKVIKVKADVAAFRVELHSGGERCQGRPEDVHLDP